MLRYLADENFNIDIVNGLVRIKPELEFERVQETELAEAADPDDLELAAQTGQIVVTHDHRTMPSFAWKRVADGKPMSGIFVIKQTLPVAKAIEELLLMAECSSEGEWRDRVIFLPL